MDVPRRRSRLAGAGAALEYVLIAALGVPLLMLALAAIAGNMVQHRLVWSGESLKPKFSKISPAAASPGSSASRRRRTSPRAFSADRARRRDGGDPVAERHRLESMVRFDPAAILDVTTSLTLRLLGAVVAMLAVVAIADYFFQYRQWYERQKMSLQDMKQEFKQSEGDPHIKAASGSCGMPG